MSERGFEDQLKQRRGEFRISREERREDWTLLQRQLDQQLEHNAALLRMMSTQMGMAMRLSEKGGVRTPTAFAVGSVRSRVPAGPMSGDVPGRQDPDGASSRGVLASALDRAGVGGVVPAEVGQCVQPVDCERDRGFGLDALHQAPMPVWGENPVEEERESVSRPGGGGLDVSEDDEEDDPEVMRIESSRKTAGGDVYAIAGAKPTAAESHEGLPGAGEGMIDDPSARNSSDAGGSSIAGDSDSSRASGDGSGSAGINGGDSSAGGGSNSSVAGKSDGGNRSISGSSNGSGGAADADDAGGAGQQPNRFISRTRDETRRLAEAYSFPSIGGIALKVEYSRWSREVVASTVACRTLGGASLFMVYRSEQSEVFDPGGRTTAVLKTSS